MTLVPTDLPPAQVRSASRATYAAFIGAGFVFASWAARIPQVRDKLHLNPSELGFVLLAVAAGSVVALPLSGPVVTRLGSRRTVTAMALLLAVGLTVAALGLLIGVVPVVVGLFLLGLANGAWDVAMNIQGALVERHLGISIMPRYHAGFSIGTVGGALIGAAMVALEVPVTAHLAAVAVLTALVVPVAVRGFLPDRDERAADDQPAAADAIGTWAAWTERRTLLIGVFVLAFAFAEGTATDWISVALIDGYHAADSVGTLAFAAFLTAMTAGRWIGPRLLDRYGRVPVVRAISLLALAGLALFVFGHWTVLAFVGAVMWGAGVSLGFPVGMSAGADDPARAASRVSVIASIGYCAFLAGPPLIGFLGHQITVLRALTSVAVLLAIAALVAGNVRPLPARTPEPAAERD